MPIPVKELVNFSSINASWVSQCQSRRGKKIMLIPAAKLGNFIVEHSFVVR